jgi:glycerol-3-phosphate acyltransferase PlsY
VLWTIGHPTDAVLFALLTGLLWIMHRANIARLVKGTEGRIRAKANPTPAPCPEREEGNA